MTDIPTPPDPRTRRADMHEAQARPISPAVRALLARTVEMLTPQPETVEQMEARWAEYDRQHPEHEGDTDAN